jgi:hypothetical protein
MTAIPGAIDPAARNNLPARRGYTWRGQPGLIEANRRILADRARHADGRGRPADAWFEWGGKPLRPYTDRRNRKDTP